MKKDETDTDLRDIAIESSSYVYQQVMSFLQSNNACDRSIWLYFCPDPNSTSDSWILLAISAFEANELIPLFRSGQVPTRLHMFAARLHERHSTLFHCPELTLPAGSPPLPYSEVLDPELIVFSGSLYFESAQDEKAYCCFLGFLPLPRTEEHTKWDFKNQNLNLKSFGIKK